MFHTLDRVMQAPGGAEADTACGLSKRRLDGPAPTALAALRAPPYVKHNHAIHAPRA
jgi:hypothetical protein